MLSHEGGPVESSYSTLGHDFTHGSLRAQLLLKQSQAEEGSSFLLLVAKVQLDLNAHTQVGSCR